MPATVLDWGIELRFWVATCVSGLSLFSARALGLSLDGTTTSAIAIVFFATIALYNLDGSLDTPRRTSSADSALGRRRRRLHLALTGLSSGALLVLVARLSPRALLLIGSGALVCSLYAVPLTLIQETTGPSARLFRLKALPFLKAPFVGCAVATAVVWVPLWAEGSSAPFGQALALTCALSLYCTDNALLFDIPDVSEDEQAGVPTLPLCWGLSGARWASRVLIAGGLLSSAVFSALVPALSHSVGLFWLGAALLVFTQFLHFRTPRRVVAWWVDGTLLLPLSFQLVTGT